MVLVLKSLCGHKDKLRLGPNNSVYVTKERLGEATGEGATSYSKYCRILKMPVP